MRRAGIALGSNLGDRLLNLREALLRLRSLHAGDEAPRVAAVYQTEPRFCPPGSPDFLNTVVEIGFAEDPLDLLAATQQIERDLGRVPSPLRNAPRVIDVDILYLGDLRFANESLVLPHPRIGERRFVLQPLADIRPDLRIDGRTVDEALLALVDDESPLERLDEAL